MKAFKVICIFLGDYPSKEAYDNLASLHVFFISSKIFFREKLFYLQLELFCLQLSFFAYSPLRPLLDTPSHRKQKSSNCK